MEEASKNLALNDFELTKVSRLFEILIKLEKRSKENPNDLRTDKNNTLNYNKKTI